MIALIADGRIRTTIFRDKFTFDRKEEEKKEKKSLVEPYNFGIQLIHDAH